MPLHDTQQEILATLRRQRAKDIVNAALAVAAIQAQQKGHPGFADATLDCIVNSELRTWQKDTGDSLDEIAVNWPDYIEEDEL